MSDFRASAVLTVEECADELKCSVSDVLSLIEGGVLSAKALGGNLRVPVVAFQRYLGEAPVQEQQNILYTIDKGGVQSYPHTPDLKFVSDWEEDDSVAYSEGSVFYSEKFQTWRAQFTVMEGGVKKRKLINRADSERDARDKMEAAKRMAELASAPLIQLAAPASVPAPTIAMVSQQTFGEYYQSYLESKVGSGSARAFKDKLRIGRDIIKALGHFRLDALTSQVLETYINKVANTPRKRGKKESYYSQSSLNKVYDNLHCVVKEAHRQGLILQDPMLYIKKPQTKEFKEDVVKSLTDEEMKRILNGVKPNPMLYLLVTILAYTGIRPGEAYALKYSDFDFAKKTVYIKRTLSVDCETDLSAHTSKDIAPLIKILKNERSGKKMESARRQIKVSDHVLALVQARWDEINHDPAFVKLRRLGVDKFPDTQDCLFVAPTDGELKMPEYYNATYRKALKRVGLCSKEYRFYRFRHTFCTRLFTVHKLNPKEVAQMMGDNSLDMIMNVYYSLDKDSMIRNSAAFAAQMDASLGI